MRQKRIIFSLVSAVVGNTFKCIVSYISVLVMENSDNQEIIAFSTVITTQVNNRLYEYNISWNGSVSGVTANENEIEAESRTTTKARVSNLARQATLASTITLTTESDEAEILPLRHGSKGKRKSSRKPSQGHCMSLRRRKLP